MKLDTQKPGLCALFKPYKAALIKHLYETTEFMSHEGAQGSGELWGWLEENAERLGIEMRSRASVINALNDLVDEGILKWRDETGKGGHHRLYSVFLSYEGFEHLVCTTFGDKLNSIFEGDWWKLEAEEAKLRPSCYGAFGSEECITVGCVFQDSCEEEETQSFEKARRALNE